MPVPDFESLMLPTLKAFAGRNETPISAIRAQVANSQGLSNDDVLELLPSGRQKVFVNRVSWAVIYLERAGLLQRIKRGVYQLTQDGNQLLSDKPQRIDQEFLGNYPAFQEWKQKSGAGPSSGKKTVLQQNNDLSVTPDEALEQNVQQLRQELENEVLGRVRAESPAFLEQLILDLLIKMGYGSGDAERGRVTGRSGDGGIDGTIREDALGLDEVYLQAKNYHKNNIVGESALRNFAGAIDAAGTTKGVFVTTSHFTPAARKYVEKSPKRIVLIDGKELARLMFDHGVGVRIRTVYKVKRIDEDYFNLETT
ncbi:MAG: restriction endonuclease [Rhodobacteraceae bacterium]|nr:restriction endonuclease [Paracoccaceae bacterium]